MDKTLRVHSVPPIKDQLEKTFLGRITLLPNRGVFCIKIVGAKIMWLDSIERGSRARDNLHLRAK